MCCTEGVESCSVSSFRADPEYLREVECDDTWKSPAFAADFRRTDSMFLQRWRLEKMAATIRDAWRRAWRDQRPRRPLKMRRGKWNVKGAEWVRHAQKLLMSLPGLSWKIVRVRCMWWYFNDSSHRRAWFDLVLRLTIATRVFKYGWALITLCLSRSNQAFWCRSRYCSSASTLG